MGGSNPGPEREEVSRPAEGADLASAQQAGARKPDVERAHADKVSVAMQTAARQWEAEQENARRLSTRTTGILATIAAASGLGLFKASDITCVENPWLSLLLQA